MSLYRNRPGIPVGVRLAPGPDGKPRGSYEFYGRRNSYIYFPNNGRIDTKTSITILAWIYHTGHSGPIFHYLPNGWGVHFWMVGRRTIFARLMKRGRRPISSKYISSSRITPYKWQYVGMTYDFRTGVAKLYLNSRVIAQKRIGRFRIATNYPVRMGVKIGDRRYFRGRISCVQVYDVALNANQIARRKRRCFRKGMIFTSSDCCKIISQNVEFPKYLYCIFK